MYVRIKVIPGAKKERVTKHSDTEFEMMVKEPAQRNLANTRVRELLAEMVGVDIKSVRLIAGHRSKIKLFDVTI